MDGLELFELSKVDVNDLHAWLCSQEEVTPFLKNVQKSALITSYTILREVGGINDNLALHLFDAETGKKIERSLLNGSLVLYEGMVGVRITSGGANNIEVRVPGISEFTRPTANGFIIFPELAARYLLQENIEPVLVKRWLMHTTFSTFNPKIDLYRDQMWELAENDALLYAQLIANRQMVLQGIHDIVDHAASAQADGWTKAAEVASEMHKTLSDYFFPLKNGNISSHLIPFAAGVVLDELTQMPHYGSHGRIATIQALLLKLRQTKIHPQAVLALSGFPISIDEVTAAARNAKCAEDLPAIQAAVDRYASDVHRFTYRVQHN